MNSLEPNKIYKIKPPDVSLMMAKNGWNRDYILCSPKNRIFLRETKFDTHFIICFDGQIIVNERTTSFREGCTLEELTPSDLYEIRKAIELYNATHDTRMVYNRKKNCLIFK